MTKCSVRFRALALATVVMGALATPPAATAQNLVTNFDFETGDFTGWTQFGLTSFSGVSAFAPYSGGFAYEFGEVDGTGGILQLIPTTAGASYTLSFWLMNEGNVPPNFFEASWDGLSQLSFTDAPAFAYTFFSYSVTATSALTELRFTAQNNDFYWDLDDVSVVQVGDVVPEPASLTLLATGLAGLIGSRRRKARR